MKGGSEMIIQHTHPMYKTELEYKNTVKKKYEEIYGSIIENRKNKDEFIEISTAS
jgi:hypothetical protein